MNPREKIIYLALKYRGDWNNIYRAMKSKEEVDEEEVYETLQYLDCDVMTIVDSDYPDNLFNIYKPPFVLFYKGDRSLLNQYDRTLAVVGRRDPTSYGIITTHSILEEIDKERIIVSGLAYGVDRIAHEVALERGMKVIAVIGSGLDHFYPMENYDLFEKIKNVGIVVSEYPSFVFPERINFPRRNRIIAGLARGVLITEAQKRSGTSITANAALAFGRDVYCVPSQDLNNSGCNELIKEGAYLVESGSDVENLLQFKKNYYVH